MTISELRQVGTALSNKAEDSHSLEALGGGGAGTWGCAGIWGAGSRGGAGSWGGGSSVTQSWCRSQDSRDPVGSQGRPMGCLGFATPFS